MKKALIVASLLALGSAGAYAQQGGFTGPAATPAAKVGGFSGPTTTANTVTTVAQAKQMRDDSKVTLRGKILQHLGKDKYLFEDSTGQITIEIDHDDWRGVTAGPTDQIEIYGEVDKDWNSVEIDVDVVRKIN